MPAHSFKFKREYGKTINQMVIEALQETAEPMSAMAIFKAVIKKVPIMKLSSVYSSLDRLKRKKEISQIGGPRGDYTLPGKTRGLNVVSSEFKESLEVHECATIDTDPLNGHNYICLHKKGGVSVFPSSQLRERKDTGFFGDGDVLYLTKTVGRMEAQHIVQTVFSDMERL